MYLRVNRQKRKDGSYLSHFQIAHNTWDSNKKRSRVSIIHSVGRTTDTKAVDGLKRLANSILARCAPQQLAAEHPDWHFNGSWPWGDLYVLEQLWQQLGIPQAIRKALGSRRLRCNVERALFAMVANRACAPASKLYCCQQWLAEDVRIPDTSTLSLQHLYRAMDFLEANRNAIEEEVFWNTRQPAAARHRVVVL